MVGEGPLAEGWMKLQSSRKSRPEVIFELSSYLFSTTSRYHCETLLWC